MCNAAVLNHEQTTLFPLKHVGAYDAFNVSLTVDGLLIAMIYCGGGGGYFQINQEIKDIKKDRFFLNLLAFSERQHCA